MTLSTCRKKETQHPKLRFHKHSNRAYVELSGKRVYLGKWDDPQRDQKYHMTLAAWERNGRVYPIIEPAPAPSAVDDLVVVEICAAYLEYAESYYVHKDGTPTGQQDRVRAALKGVQDLYADVPAAKFGPTKLNAVREHWIRHGLARTSINAMVGCVKLAFRWAASREMISPSVYYALATLEGLRMGRSKARETEPVKPVPEAHINAIQPFVASQVWTMIQLQLLTGARPGEIVLLKNAMIDRSGKVWTAKLEDHKTAYRRKERVLYFGPKAQEILRPWLLARPVGEYLFSPQEALAEAKAKDSEHGRRPNQLPSPRKTDRVLGEHYTPNSYARAIRRACTEKAKIPVWSPNRLRHNAATRIRKEFGLEAAQVILGHSKADTTQIYAELNEQKALSIIKKFG